MAKPAPLSVYLPFNRECLGAAFGPAKHAAAPAEPRGRWLLVQNQGLVVAADGGELRLPEGERPAGLDGTAGPPLCLGRLGGTPCWVAALAADAALPPGLQR